MEDENEELEDEPEVVPEEVDDNEDDDDGPEPEPEEDPEPEPEPEDEDERFIRDAGGKPIPLKVFKKKYAKWKERHAAEAQKVEKALADFEGYKKATTVTPDQIKQYKGLETVFGRFNEAVEAKPWLKPVLWALGAGEELTPELLQGLQKALADEIKTPSRVDPTISRELATQRAQLAELQQERLTTGVETHLARENSRIAKILGGNQAALKLVNELAVKMTPERGTLADMPDRVALARQIAGMSKASVQAELKKRIPVAGAARANVRIGSGPAPARTRQVAADDDDVPDFKDREALQAWLSKKPA